MGPLRKRDADATGRRGHGVIGHRHHAAGVTGTPGGGADGSGVAVHQLGPLLLGQAETHQSPVLRVREGQGHDDSQGGTNERGVQRHRRILHASVAPGLGREGGTMRGIDTLDSPQKP